MLVTMFYILFFGLADFITYSLINKRENINSKLLGGFMIGLIVFVLLRTGIIDSNNLLSNKNLFVILQLVLSCVFINLMGKWSIRQTLKSRRLSEQVKNISVRGKTFVFTKFVYILVFIAQLFITMTSP